MLTIVTIMSEKHKILVVEDDEIMQRALVFSLEKATFEVTSVATIEEAVDALETSTFSIVLTDIFLPDGDGMEIQALVNKKLPEIPVLAMTAYLNMELGKRAREFFGDRLIEKPFKKKALIGKIRKLIEK